MPPKTRSSRAGDPGRLARISSPKTRKKSLHPYLNWRELGKDWRVSVQKAGRVYEKSFSVRRYGSKEKALQAALKWRDYACQQLRPEKVIKRVCRNPSGVVGVDRVCKTNPSGRQYFSWVAKWREGDRSVSRKFSVLKYGEREAFELAVSARQEAIAKCEPRSTDFPKERYMPRENQNISWRKDGVWRVRMTKDRVVHGKGFSIRQYGSKKEALKAARAWRDRRYKELHFGPATEDSQK